MNKQFIDHRMADTTLHMQRLGNTAVRSLRNAWAESIEEKVRQKAPYPITYDVSQTQPVNFHEYAYTEVASGLWVYTQSLELNARVFHLAAKETTAKPIDEFVATLTDKYNLAIPDDRYATCKKICFLPGHNLLDVASIENISRLVHEDEDVMIKPHPVTNDEAMKYIKTRLGASRIIPKDVSGNALMANCDVIYTTTTSEMTLTGTALGKSVVNVSNFFNEGSGVYHPISRIIYAAHKESVKFAQQVLANILHCKWSGLVFQWNDVDESLDAYFSKSLELREQFKPLASPKGQVVATKSDSGESNVIR